MASILGGIEKCAYLTPIFSVCKDYFSVWKDCAILFSDMNFDFKPKFRIERWREVYPPNGAMLRLWLEQEGYRVYQWADQPGMIYALHKDEKPQSYWIVSGALEFYVGGQTYMLETVDRAFL